MPRVALYERLNGRRPRPLTLVIAPAGYGKSTLLSSWLDTLTGVPSAWLSLEDQDDDLGTFLTYFIAAIQTMFPQVGQNTLSILHQAESVPLRALLATLINELNTISDHFVLVLDDFHVIQQTAIQELMTNLLMHAPATFHIVLASRVDPRLPIPLFRARNQVTEIRAGDLRFSRAEAAVFFSNGLETAVDDRLLERIYERSEGWVTGLHLAALSMRHLERQPQVEGVLAREDRFLLDYLLSEVLSAQPEIVQEWLLRTSILDRFSCEICDAVLEAPAAEGSFDGHQFIRHLTKYNLFVISLDHQQTWYRYHQLFGEFLAKQLSQRSSPAAINMLHTKASRWLAQNGLLEEALHHALAAGDFAAAAQLIEQNARQMLDKDQWHILKDWLAYLPESSVQQSAMLLLTKVWVAFHQFALWDIPPLLASIERNLRAGDEDAQRPLWGEVDFFWGHHWFWEGRQEQSLALLNQALEKIPKSHHLARGNVELFWGLAMQMNGQDRKAIRQLHTWLYYEKTWDFGVPSKLQGALIFIHLLSAELQKAASVTRQLQEVAENTENPYLIAWSSFLEGIGHYYANELEKAVLSFTRADRNRYILHYAAAIDNLSGLALAYQALGQSENAASVIADLQGFALETSNPMYISRAYSSQAHLSLLQGDVQQALHQFQTVDVATDASLMFYWVETPRLTHCRVLIAQGTEAALVEADRLLAQLLQTERNYHNTIKVIEILLLQTVCYARQGLAAPAVRALYEAVVLAEPGVCLRPFVEAGPELLELLPQLPQSDSTDPFVRLIREVVLADTGQPADAPAAEVATAGPDSDLTFREREILALLAEGSSNKDIADQLTISPHTVKRHVYNLTKKLGARNRRQAVAMAREKDLLKR